MTSLSITKPTMSTTSGDSNPYVNPYPDDQVVRTVFLVWTIVIMCTGCLGNVLVISAVWLHRSLRNIGNIFIVNLAVADMGVSLVVNVFGVVGMVTEARFFVGKEWLCELVAVICVTSCACSMWSIAAIGVNRYVSICHWARYGDIYNRRTVPVMLLGIWVICFLVDFPNVVGWGDHRFDWKTMVCTSDMAVEFTYALFFSTVGFGLPLVVVIYSYINIYYHAYRSTARLNKVAREDGVSSRRSSDMRLVRSLLIIVIVFVIMWAPFALNIIINHASISHRNVYVFSALIAHSNSSINCIIYAATNKNFRQSYAYILKRVFCRAAPALQFVLKNNLSPSQRTIELDDQV